MSAADIAAYPWARARPWAMVSGEGLDELKAWFARIDACPAVRRALTLPKPVPAFRGDVDAEDFPKETAGRVAADVPKA